jgi:hypothetical protein
LGTRRPSKIDGTTLKALGPVSATAVSAIAVAAARVMAWLISVARQSRAPRQIPGDARPELIWLGTSGRPVA